MAVFHRLLKIVFIKQESFYVLITVLILLEACSGSHNRVNNLYAHHCLGCHGVSGRGNGPLSSKLTLAVPDFRDTVIRKTVPQIRKIIASGKGIMPAFGHTLSKAEIQDMLQIVHTLSREGRNLTWWEKIEPLSWAHCNVPWEFVFGYNSSQEEE